MAEKSEVAIVVVPFPAQSHLNQLLHFSLVLSSHGFPVHFASSATHNRQVQRRAQGWDPKAVENVHFHDLPLPSFSIPLPDPNSNFPSHLQPMFDALDHLEAPVAALLCSVSATCYRLVVIHDPLMSFAGLEAVTLPNAEVYRFHCLPAFYLLRYFCGKEPSKLAPMPKNLDLLFSPLDGHIPEEFLHFVLRRDKENPLECGFILNTCRAVENEFIDLLSQLPPHRNMKHFVVGPLNLLSSTEEPRPRHKCLEWLDKQPPASVVYVSFGTTTTVPDEQIEQLAIGLQNSRVRFIWILREADLSDIFVDSEEGPQKKLPAGFEKDVEGEGMVVTDWAPQVEILAHPSTGGFMSHCGWNSCMESLSMGVPIIAWPMHSDQPRNAMVVSEYLKSGATVRDWSRHEEIISAAEIEESIKRVMVYDEGKEIKKRAKALGEAIRLSVSEGGSSRVDMDSFIAHIAR